jgi:glycosyltransferase involved in cell wall biosynthesis
MKIVIVSGTSVFDNLAGSEMQMRQLGAYLVKQGHSVVYYFREYVADKPSCHVQEGATVYRNQRQHGNLLGPIRDVMRLKSIAAKEKPNLLYTRCIRSLFVLDRVSHTIQIPFVYHVPMALDKTNFSFVYHLKNFRKSIIQTIYGYFSFRGLKNAARLLTISNEDAKVLKETLGLEAETIYNMHPTPAATTRKAEKPIVVWINNIKAIKRPEHFIELASRCEDTEALFIMSGCLPKDNYGKRINRQILKARSLQYIGPTSLDMANSLLSDAYINIVTSQNEGFGNGNIQGWFRETPTVTTVDKDRVVERNMIGFHVSNLDEMEKKLRHLLKNQQLCIEMGKRARAYAIENHSVDIQGPKYINLFENVVRESRRLCFIRK